MTLTGSGGCGKTRLALHAAAGRVGSLPDGVWLVELAPLTDPGQVSGAIAAALSVRAAGAASDLDGLATAIGGQALLLVLDNCEHLARHCAEVAARLAGAAGAFAHSAGLAGPKATAELIDSVAGACRAALGHDRFAEAWAAGEGMTLEDAAAYASRGRGRRRRPATGWAALTPTELRVARAVADGLSNPQIAERMFISRRTVATHLTSIFRKLGVSSRAELAAVAVRRDG